MATREQHAARPGRESLSKRLGRVARQIKARDGHCCVYCGATEASENRAGRHMHLDHLDTHVSGGADVATNLVLAWLCGRDAITERTVEGLAMPLCEEHAAELDRETAEGEG